MNIDRRETMKLSSIKVINQAELYIYTLRAGSKTFSKKMLILK